MSTTNEIYVTVDQVTVSAVVGTAENQIDIAQVVINGGGGGGGLSDGDFGDITVSGTGTVMTIDNDVVTFAKMQNITTARLLGRATAATGDVEEITLGDNLGFNGTTLDATAGGASIGGSWNFDTSTTAADPGNKDFRMNNATIGSVTELYFNDTTNQNFDAGTILGFLVSGNRIYIQQKDDASKAALFQVSGAATDNGGWWTVPVTVVASGTIYGSNKSCAIVFVMAVAGGAGVSDGDKGDITVTSSGAVWTIDAGVVTLAKMADIATARFIGRTTAATGVPEALTGTQATAMLDLFSTSATTKGLVIGSNGAATTNFLRADGTWAIPAGGSADGLGPDGDKGDITVGGTGTTLTIDNDVVTNAKLANMAANTIKGNDTAGSTDPTDIAVGANTVLGRVAGNIVAAALVNAQIATNTITGTTQAQMAANTIKANATASTTNEADLAVGTNVVVGRVAGNIVAATLVDAQIATNTISNASRAQMATNTVKANATAGTANEADLTVGTNTVLGRVGGNIVAATLVDAQIATNTISNASRAQMATNTVKANATAGTANEADLTIGTNTVLGRVAGNIVAATLVDGQIAANTISAASQAQMAANTVKANATAGTANEADLAVAANTVVGRVAGNIVAAALVNAQIATNTITGTTQAQMATNTIKSNATAGTANESDLSVGTNTVVGRVAGNIVAAQLVDGQITTNTISNSKLAQVATATIRGRVTAATGDIENLTGTQATTLLDVFATGATTKGVVPGSNSVGATFYLNGNGAWSIPAGGSADGLGTDGDKGDVTVGGTGTTLTIDANAVTFAKMQDVSAASKLLGRGAAGGAGDPEEITLGTNLSMTGTTLNATGGGGSGITIGQEMASNLGGYMR